MNRPLRDRVGRAARAGGATLVLVTLLALHGLAGRSSEAHSTEAAAAEPIAPALVDRPVWLPPGYATPGLCRIAPRPWMLPGHGHTDLAQLLGEVGLDPAQQRAIDASSRCDGAGCAIDPPTDVVLGLAPDARAALYARLARFPENTEQWVPFRRRKALGPWSAHPALAEPERALLDRLTYEDGPFFLLADFARLCAELPRDDAKTRVLTALMSRGTVDGTRSNARAADRPGSTRISDLLPPFARARLGIFPRTDDPAYSCFWTALHFLDEGEPDPRIADEHEVLATLERDYLRVPIDERRLGDTLLFVSAQGRPVHAANQVDGDVVFTKNGASFLRPWVLMRLEDVQASYPSGSELRVYRLRRLAHEG